MTRRARAGGVLRAIFVVFTVLTSATTTASFAIYSDNISTRHAIAASSKINMITFNMTVIELQYSTIDLNDVYRNADSGTDLVAVSVPLSGFTTQLVLLAGYSDLLSSSRLIIDRLELFLADDFGWYNYQSVLNYQTS